ncbi:hypothetical protein LX36DRAFT_487726 [Colletotrichum falcatum]|nr:hypothetical protein LX36DRAFT_487726 [Colletotrichum falcatum]
MTDLRFAVVLHLLRNCLSQAIVIASSLSPFTFCLSIMAFFFFFDFFNVRSAAPFTDSLPPATSRRLRRLQVPNTSNAAMNRPEALTLAVDQGQPRPPNALKTTRRTHCLCTLGISNQPNVNADTLSGSSFMPPPPPPRGAV